VLDYRQVRKYACIPALRRVMLWDPSAEVLCMGTAMVESKLTYIDQKDKADKPGPAFGLCQMEGPTHADLYRTILSKDRDLRRRVLECATFFSSEIPDPAEMQFNLLYSFVMCRVFYRRVPAALPAADDALALANYHKRYYNTYLGATKVSESVEIFKEVIARSKEKV
jgi:hypothetical protein